MIREIILILLIAAIWRFLSLWSRSKQSAFTILANKLAEQQLEASTDSIKLEKLGLVRNKNPISSIVRVYSFTCSNESHRDISGQLVVGMKGAKSAILHYANGPKVIEFDA